MTGIYRPTDTIFFTRWNPERLARFAAVKAAGIQSDARTLHKFRCPNAACSSHISTEEPAEGQ
jgi:hypothetical protein